MISNDTYISVQYKLFTYALYISYILYIIIAIGISSQAPEYLINLQNYIKLYVSLFLIIRFNPFAKITFTKLDRDVSFSAGVFLFTTTTITQILITYLDQIKNILSSSFL